MSKARNSLERRARKQYHDLFGEPPPVCPVCGKYRYPSLAEAREDYWRIQLTRQLVGAAPARWHWAYRQHGGWHLTKRATPRTGRVDVRSPAVPA